jgi:hypothetical protein
MKPTQEQILRALNKLVRENKTELKAEKIELGLDKDIKSDFTQANNFFGDGFNEMEDAKISLGKAEKLLMRAEQFYGKTLESVSKFETAAKELGIDLPSDIAKIKKTSEANLKGSTKNLNQTKQAKKLADFS